MIHDKVQEDNSNFIQVEPQAQPKVKFINNTFKEMFLKFGMEQILDLRRIYLKKQPFKIVNK